MSFSIGLARPIKRENWLSMKEAAAILGVSVSGLRKLIGDGQPNCPRFYQVKDGSPILFRKEWLDDWIEARSQPAKPIQPPPKAMGRKPKTGPLSPWWDDLEQGRK